jgi:hypothetical protein
VGRCSLVPNVTVELGLSKAFTLDDPVAGVIGSDEFTIGGVLFVDVTDRVNALSITRGKNRDLDRFSAGNLTVEFNNEDRAFDPLNTASPFAGNIVPRRDIRVMADSESQYVGKIVDWNFLFEPAGRQSASVQAADAFTFLGQQVLTPGTATPQLTGARINAVLSQPTIDWPLDKRVIDVGNSSLGADEFDGNALTYLQQVETSEVGLLFIDKAGNVRFRDRLATPTTDSFVVFADDGTGIPFAPAELDYGTELLYNQVIATSPTGSAVANGLLSQTRYGILEETVDTLLSDSDQLEDLAEFLVGRYQEPELRFASIGVNLRVLSAGELVDVLGLELGDVVQVKLTPGNPPSGAKIERFGLVISIGHTVTPDSHFVTFGLGSLQTSLFVIGDSEFGTIGVDAPGVLGF